MAIPVEGRTALRAGEYETNENACVETFGTDPERVQPELTDSPSDRRRDDRPPYTVLNAGGDEERRDTR